MKIEMTCQYCTKHYFVVQSKVYRSKYCSNDCRYKNGVSKDTKQKISNTLCKQIEVSCHYCAKVYFIEKGQIDKNKYCSRDCFYAARMGVSLSEETKLKMSIAATGKTKTEEHKQRLREAGLGNTNAKGFKQTLETCDKNRLARLGKKLSEEHRANIRTATQSEKTRQKMSDSAKNRPLPTEETKEKISKGGKGKHSGDKCPFWKGGVTLKNRGFRAAVMLLPEYVLWRKQVYERDNYTCQFCGNKGGVLHTHHINGFKNIIHTNNITTIDMALKCVELWDIDNGLTLCITCHLKTNLHSNKSISKD